MRVTCDCGAAYTAPEGAAGRTLTCPRCGNAIKIPAAELAVLSANLDRSAGESICSICQSPISPGEALHACPACEQQHHEECWQEVGGCGTFGCREAPASDKGEQTAAVPLAAWGDTKKCPACGETIKAIAIKCRYCSTEFDTVDPLTLADLHSQVRRGDRLDGFKRWIVALFVVSLLGFLAPLMAIVTAVFLLPRRDQLSKAGPVFTILGWTSLGLSCLYTVLFGLVLLMEG